MEQKTRYDQRGVSSSKSEVHTAIATLDKGLFPGAFCNIFDDIAADPLYCTIQHADGAGTKAALAYLTWKLSGDLNVWKDIAQDSIVMNIDDMICVGAEGPFFISGTIDRNKHRIPGEVLAAIIEGCKQMSDLLTKNGIPCTYTGGETADVGDLVRTVVVNNIVTTRLKRSDVIDASRIEAPALIVGFSSTGKAFWEKGLNSGIGSNGLTNARHDVLSGSYMSHRETFSPETEPGLIYSGKYLLEEPLPGDERFTIASALLSPTRTYAPLVKSIFSKIKRENILGLIHCSGGGQTKIGKFGKPGTIYLKNNLMPIPPLFSFLKETKNLSWEEAFKSYNMGHRLEIVVRNEKDAESCISLSKDYNIHAQIIGEVLKNEKNPTGRTVIIKGKDVGTLEYEFK